MLYNLQYLQYVLLEVTEFKIINNDKIIISLIVRKLWKSFDPMVNGLKAFTSGLEFDSQKMQFLQINRCKVYRRFQSAADRTVRSGLMCCGIAVHRRCGADRIVRVDPMLWRKLRCGVVYHNRICCI